MDAKLVNDVKFANHDQGMVSRTKKGLQLFLDEINNKRENMI